MNRFLTAAVAASLFVPAIAEAQFREPVSVTVHRGDLDLHRADQRAVLEGRVRRAAARACGNLTSDIVSNLDVEHCRKEMLANASNQIAALVAAPTALASNR